MRAELGDEYVERLRQLYAGRVPGGADFVTYWFERARALIATGKLQRAGLLATDSIRNGANRRVLEQIKAKGKRRHLHGLGGPTVGAGRRGRARVNGRLRWRHGNGSRT
jgi:hypothetical protein